MVKWAAGISGVMLVAGPLLIALPSLVSGLGKVKIALIGISRTITVIAIPAIAKLKGAMLGLVASGGPFALIILGLVAMGIAWDSNLFGMKDTTKKVFDDIRGNFSRLRNELEAGGGAVGAFFDDVIESAEKIKWEKYHEGVKELNHIIQYFNESSFIDQITYLGWKDISQRYEPLFFYLFPF